MCISFTNKSLCAERPDHMQGPWVRVPPTLSSGSFIKRPVGADLIVRSTNSANTESLKSIKLKYSCFPPSHYF